MRRPCVWIGRVRHRDGVWEQPAGAFANPAALRRYLARPYERERDPHWRRWSLVEVSPTRYETGNGVIILELARQEIVQ